jgi:hypothetical protein
MTISSTTQKNSHSANGSTHSFAYGFKIFANGDLEVIVRTAAGVETTKTLDTHYVVTNAGNSSGGNVLFKYNTGTSSDAHYSATDYRPANGETVVIRRNLTLTQGTDYVENDPFPSASHEDALDRLTFITQQIQEGVDRSIKITKGNTLTSTEFATSATDRASKVLGFDSSGNLSVTSEVGNFKGNWATSTAFVLRDIVIQNSTSDATTYKNVYICTTAHTSSGSYLTASDTSNWAVLVEVAAFDTISELGDTTISSPSGGHLLIYDGSDSWDNKAMSGDATIATTGAITIAADAVESGMLNDNIISGQTALTSGLASTDEFILSDAGALKRIDVSVLTDYYKDLTVTETNKTLTSPVLNTGISGTAVKDEDDMSSNSATHLATQQSIKAYVDSQIATEDTIAELNDTNISSPSGGHILVYDGSDSWDNVAVSGDVTIATNGAVTIASTAVENSMLAGSIADTKLNTISTAGKVDIGALEIDGATDIGADLADADLLIVDDGANGTERKSTFTRVKKYVYSAMSGDATASDTGAVTIASGAVETGMLADDSVDADKLAANAVVNASVASSAAIADTKLATISTANKVSVAALDIDGATDIGADIVDADLFIIDDGAGGTNRKVAASRIKTYAQGTGASQGFAIAMAICL